MMLVRLSRIIPFLLVLAVVAGVIYVVMTYRHSPSRAKEILIKLFIWITSLTSGFFALVSLYAWFEHNEAVFDLAFSFLLTMLIGLGITLWCRAIFLKRHPEYRKKPQRTKRLKSRGGKK